MEKSIICLEDVFEMAKNDGIKKGALGIVVYGRKGYANIYTLKNPTQATVKKVYEAYIFLKKMKKNEKK